MNMDDADDQRVVELGTLAAIYPEMVTDEADPFTVMLDIPVQLGRPATVHFPGAAGGGAQGVHMVSHLPPVQLRVTLPPGYPETVPPEVAVSTHPPWISAGLLRGLENDGPRLWDELGRDPVVFTLVDHIQQAADDAFGLVDGDGNLAVSPEYMVQVLDYDVKAKQAAFYRETYTCGICLDPKSGTLCHSMRDCGHVFCVQCLQDYYNAAIAAGDLPSIQCPEPDCAKNRRKAMSAGRRGRRPRLMTLSPGELLQIPLEGDVVKRYVDLKYKQQLDSDKNTIYCPRTWCNGATRSKRHRRPRNYDGPEDEGEEEDESPDEDPEPRPATDAVKAEDEDAGLPPARLVICEDCDFAFCSRCFQSWHGEFVFCGKRKDGDVPDEDRRSYKLSLEYIALHTTPCPACAAPIQKTMGCNHMICHVCHEHFCYLCSSWLDPSNPYSHFNSDSAPSACNNRLWELRNVGEGEQAFDRPAEEGGPPEENAAENGGRRGAAADQRGQAVENGAVRVNVAREGPLVLRIDVAPQPAPQPAPRPIAQPRAPPVNGVNGRPAGHGQRGRGRARGGGGVVRGRPAVAAGGGNGRGRGRGGMRAQRGGGRAGGLDGLARHEAVALHEAEEAGVDAQMMNDDLEAWVRHFVQLALEDNEDLLD